MQLKGDRADDAAAHDIVQLQYDLARLAAALRIFRIHASADHPLDDLIARKVLRRTGLDDIAVPDHGRRIAHLEDLIHFVRNIHYGRSVFLQRVHDLEQVPCLARRQRGRRLVHNDDARLFVQDLGDLHHLLLRGRKSLNLCGRPEVKAERVQKFLRSRVDLLPVYKSPAAIQLVQEHVFCNRK